MADDTEHLTASGPAHALARLIFFSDAVFAIAITLLVIEIHVPEIPAAHPTDRDFLIALVPMIPNFIGFFVSFFVIANFWAGHHRVFDCARHWDQRLMMPNMMLLAAIAAMPFFTAYASEYYGQRVPTTLYCGWLLLTALLNIRLQRIAMAPPVVGEDVPDEKRGTLRRRGMAGALGAATAVGVSLIDPYAAQPALISIMFWRMLLQRLGRKG